MNSTPTTPPTSTRDVVVDHTSAMSRTDLRGRAIATINLALFALAWTNWGLTGIADTIAVSTTVLAPLTGNATLWTLLPGTGAAPVLHATCASVPHACTTANTNPKTSTKTTSHNLIPLRNEPECLDCRRDQESPIAVRLTERPSLGVAP